MQRVFPLPLSRHLLVVVLVLGGIGLLFVAGCRTPGTPETSAEPPGPPVVFVHGMAGFDRAWGVLEYWPGMVDDLAATGRPAYAPRLAAYASIAHRAEELAGHLDAILEETGAERVHLIGHSQGGLDIAWLVGELGYADRVATATTVASPHAGTPTADIATFFPSFALWPLFGVSNTLLSGTLQAPDVEGAMSAVRTDRFWKEPVRARPPPEDLLTFSLAGSVTRPSELCHGAWGQAVGLPAPGLWAVPLNRWLDAQVGDNDGLVPASSARWGTFLGCLPADHLGLVGISTTTMRSEGAGAYSARELFGQLIEALDRAALVGKAAPVVGRPPPAVARFFTGPGLLEGRRR